LTHQEWQVMSVCASFKTMLKIEIIKKTHAQTREYIGQNWGIKNEYTKLLYKSGSNRFFVYA